MAEPEIHVVSQKSTGRTSKEKTSSKRRARKEDRTSQGAPKRPRKEAAGSEEAVKGNVGEDKQAVVRLSTNTQSFRHLFSFGEKRSETLTKIGSGNELEEGHPTSKVECTVSERAFQPAKEPFSLFGEPHISLEHAPSSPRRGPETPASDEKRGSGSVGNGQEVRKIAEEYVVRDGLALDSENDVLAMARTYCGADCSVERLEEEWFDGGKKESMREVLRTKRLKHLRGRTLGSSAKQNDAL